MRRGATRSYSAAVASLASPGEYSDGGLPTWFTSLVPMPGERRIGGSAVKPSRTQFSCEGYAAVQPPSTTTTWPVQYVDVGAQRNSRAASSSASAPGRPAGHMRRSHFIAASLQNISVFISVGKKPGARQLTRTPLFAHWTASARVRLDTAPFEAGEATS